MKLSLAASIARRFAVYLPARKLFCNSAPFFLLERSDDKRPPRNWSRRTTFRTNYENIAFLRGRLSADFFDR